MVCEYDQQTERKEDVMKVLYLSAWYPTERDAMAGLFVQKHAESVIQQGADVRVLYTEAKGTRWYIEMWRKWRELKREWGLPDVVQMNVLDKNGLLAWWLKKRYNIPYIIVEHWSGYLPANFSFRGGLHGTILKAIARQAACILPVSQMLENAMKACGIKNNNWQRIHNVVDDFFYHPLHSTSIPEKREGKVRLLHVSCFDEKAKNIQGMLRAVRKVADERQDFELIVVGTGVDYKMDHAYAESLQFPDGILHFTGEQTPKQVAEWMHKSDVFVMFSRYENAPVVLSECLATGLPIISSNAGGIPEMITESCGILIQSENEIALADALIKMLQNPTNYSAENIRKQGLKYAYQAVGKKLVETYESALQQKRATIAYRNCAQ